MSSLAETKHFLQLPVCTQGPFESRAKPRAKDAPVNCTLRVKCSAPLLLEPKANHLISLYLHGGGGGGEGYNDKYITG